MDRSIATEHVASRDGTPIGSLRQGTGPGIVLVQGALADVLQSVQRGPASSLRALLPGVRYDFRAVAERDGRIEDHADVDCPVLLLSGTASPAFLRTAIRDLAGIIPDSRHVEFDGLGHDGPWNSGGPAQISTAPLLLHALNQTQQRRDSRPVTDGLTA